MAQTSLRSLPSAFVIRYMESGMTRLDTDNIFIIIAFLCSWIDWFEPNLVANTEDKFSRVGSHIQSIRKAHTLPASKSFKKYIILAEINHKPRHCKIVMRRKNSSRKDADHSIESNTGC